MLAVEAIKRAGSTDKAKVRDALEATRGYIGTGGVVNMSAQDHMGLDLSAFRMLEVRKGELDAGQVIEQYLLSVGHTSRGSRSARSTRWSRSASRSSTTRATSSTSPRASS